MFQLALNIILYYILLYLLYAFLKNVSWCIFMEHIHGGDKGK